MAKRQEASAPASEAQAVAKSPVLKRVGAERVQIEFLIDDLIKQLVADRGGLVANGCKGCGSCA